MSLIKPRYQYKKFSKKNIGGSRKYMIGENHHLPSVTTIIDSQADKSFLYEWRQRVGPQRATEISTEASGRGTRMHAFLEYFIKYGDVKPPGSNPYSKQARKMADVVLERALAYVDEFWGIEVNLYIPNLYAGTTDLVGVYKGNPAICDYKQANKPKKEEWVDNYKLQLVAYAEAHNELYNTDIQEGHVFMCSAAYEYQQFDIWPSEYGYWRDRWYENLYKYWEAQL